MAGVVEQAHSLRTGDLLAVQGCKTPARLTAIVPQVSCATRPFSCVRTSHRRKTACAPTSSCRSSSPEAPWTGRRQPEAKPAQAVVRHQGLAYVFVQTPKGFVPTAVVLGAEGTPDPGALRPEGTAALPRRLLRRRPPGKGRNCENTCILRSTPRELVRV